YVGPITYLFSASVRDNLLLGLRHRPRRVPDDGSAGEPSRAREIEEARKSGNIEYDIAADWIDYQQAGVADVAELEMRMVEVLRLVDLEEDVHLFGLRGRVDPDRQPDAAQRVLRARPGPAERPQSCRARTLGV